MEIAVFVQVTQGRTSQTEALYEAMERWNSDLSAGAAGWLGTTAGVTDDGRAIAMYRFESEEAARRMSERPEQEQWWTEAKQHFEAEPVVQFSSEVTLDLQGDPDQAGFVQFRQGQVSDPARAKELMAQHSSDLAVARPDVLGSIIAEHGDGAYTAVSYFTSEAEARKGERNPVPAELQPDMEEMGKLSVGEPEYFDLRRPMILSPSGD
jgi:hypothetical protein